MSARQNYQVTGMSCGHCENAIATELAALEGIEGVEVDASTGELRITVADGAEITDEAVIAAVDEAGYEAARV